MAYDRYKKFRKDDGTLRFVPFIKIPIRSTDEYHTYEMGKTRFDRLSYEYYGDSQYGWLILQANPSIGSFEFEIPNGTMLRIPMPIETVLTGYEASIDEYKQINGI
jgi:phage tail protein X